jgi:hypothetical protein
MRIRPANEPGSYDGVLRALCPRIGEITTEAYALEEIGSRLLTPRHPGGQR